MPVGLPRIFSPRLSTDAPAMGREKMKLGIEQVGSGVRYKRMVNGRQFKSHVFPQASRENKRAAWEAFVQWRESAAPASPPRDNYSLIRDVLAQQVDALKDHAELTGNTSETAMLKKIRRAIPKANPNQLHQVSALLLNDEVIEDRKQTARRLRQQTDSDLTARALADDFIASYKRKAATNRGSWGRYGQVKVGLDMFAEWYGPSRSLQHITEKTVKDYAAHLEQLVADGKLAQTTVHDHQKTFQTFLAAVGEDFPEEISIPNNLRSPRLRIHAERKEPIPFTVDEVKLLLKHAIPRTKLFLLLMLNCGMYQGDLADLTAAEVDWNAGRIIRPRSKKRRQAIARGKAQPFKVNWSLWRETFTLLKQLGNQENLVLTTGGGGTLITHKETTRNDAIRSAYHRLVQKLKRRKLLPKTWHKTLKQLRKTGANLLEKSKDHAVFYELYLDHSSVARQNYLTSGEPVPQFDAAVKWLGRQLGVR
jgi:integrase